VLVTRVSRRLATGLAAVAIGAVLTAVTGCEAGIQAETQEPYTPGSGVWGDTGSLELRGVVAVAPRPGSATLVGTIFNQGEADDQLVEVRFRGGKSTLGADPVTLPAGGVRVLGVDTSQGKATSAALQGAPVRPGLVVPITFAFERAGSVTLDVLVVKKQGPFATVPVPKAGSGEAAGDEEAAP
jgi:hypothetical protein